jgi:hypothetical protein
MKARYLLWLGVVAWVTSCGSSSDDSEPPARIYDSFDPEVFVMKYRSAMDQVDASGHRSDIIITPPGERFKDFYLTGSVSSAQLDELLNNLRDELTALAESSGAAIRDLERTGDPARPEEEFSLRYDQRGLLGTMEVTVTSLGASGEVRIYCAIHDNGPR